MQIIIDRRNLHKIPELDKAVPETADYVTESLQKLGCRVFSPVQGSVCAFFDFGKDSAIAFRADMDGLPIEERTGLPFASCHPGKMHACGHDGHMAIALELARRLSVKKELPHNVLLVFQSAEETTGGAKDLCQSGILEEYKVEAIFSLHLWPGLEKGVIASREKEMMSRSAEVTVEITGKSAHIAKACNGLDALAAGVDFYQRVTAMEAALPDDVFRLLKFGKMESGSVRNAISDHTRLEGSLRTFDDALFRQLRSNIERIAADVEKETGCAVSVCFSEGYPPVVNPPELFQRVQKAVAFTELDAPSMITEDFSWYQQYVPGMFFFLGTGDTPALHTPMFDFDESILVKGADFFEKLAENF